jgi:hypothetical protein
MGATHWKVPFEWTENAIPPEDDLPDALSWATGTRIPEPVSLVATVLETSPGPEDRHAVETLGSEQAARNVLALAPGFSYLTDRWHVLMVNAEAAGFVLPVTYDGCSRDGLDEATSYHMRVAPTHRGGRSRPLAARPRNSHSRESRCLADLLRYACDQRPHDSSLRAGRMDSATRTRASHLLGTPSNAG